MSSTSSKNITIQLWTDLYYCRVIGIWYPEAPAEEDNAVPFNDAPFLLVLSSMFEPREEVQGGNPVAPGQHPIPKDFLEKQIRHMSYLFANEFGIFQPKSKAAAKAFIAKNTISYKMIKEIDVTVSPATGSMTLRDLRNFIDQYTEDEQKEIQVLTVGEHPLDADAKHIEKFIHADKIESQRQYISVTKLTPVYGVENAYIKNTPLPVDPAFSSLPPGTADAEMSQAVLAETEAAIAEDNTNREALETFDNMSEIEVPVLDDSGVPILDDDGNPVTEKVVPDRIQVLEKMLEDKNKQMMDVGLLTPTIPKDDDEELQPMSEADIFPDGGTGDDTKLPKSEI